MGVSYTQQKPTGVSYTQQKPTGVSYTQQKPTGVSYTQQKPTGVSYTQQKPTGVSYTQQKPTGVSYTQQKPTGVSYTQQQPTGVSYTQQQPTGVSYTQQKPTGVSYTQQQPTGVSYTQQKPTGVSYTQQKPTGVSYTQQKPTSVSKQECRGPTHPVGWMLRHACPSKVNALAWSASMPASMPKLVECMPQQSQRQSSHQCQSSHPQTACDPNILSASPKQASSLPRKRPERPEAASGLPAYTSGMLSIAARWCVCTMLCPVLLPLSSPSPRSLRLGVPPPSPPNSFSCCAIQQFLLPFPAQFWSGRGPCLKATRRHGTSRMRASSRSCQRLCATGLAR